jgi:hypothetical protein
VSQQSSTTPITQQQMNLALVQPNSQDLGAFKKTKTANQLCSWTNEQYQSMKSANTQQRTLWYMNMAFYYGNQWVELAGSRSVAANKLQTPKAPPWRVRQTVNRIRPIVRTELARLIAQKPSASVIPASGDDEDMAAAQAAEQVWESIYSNQKLGYHFSRSMFWMLITGVGFIKTWWDNNAYDPNNPDIAGNICFGSVTPFNLFVPDLREEDLQAQPYVLNSYTKTVDWVKTFYGDKIGNIEPSIVSSNELMEDAYLNLRPSGRTQPDSVLCHELWVKPGGCSYFPDGGMATIVAGELVEFNPQGIPYKHGNFPYTKFEHIPTGKFYSDSVIVDLIGLQREYNRSRSQVIEAKNLMAKPKLIAPQGSIVASKVTSRPGEIITYRPGLAPPTVLPMQSLPPYVMQEMQQTLMDMEDITGQHQVSRGSAPPGVTAATAISYLQEKDDSYLTHTYQSIERGFEEIAKQTLSHVVQYWDIERTVKVTGNYGFFDVIQLLGSDIKSGTDIRMEGGSSLPISKSARQAFLMDLMKMQFIPPEDGLKLLDMGGTQRLWEKIKVDEAQAQRENIKMKRMDPQLIQQAMMQQQQMQMMDMQQQQMDPLTGAPSDPSMGAGPVGMPSGPPPPIVAVNDWDNHGVHIEVHNNFRKTEAFEQLPPEIKDQFDQHVQMHLMQVQMAYMQASEMQGQMQMAGQPPGALGAPGAEMGGPMQDQQQQDPTMGGQ